MTETPLGKLASLVRDPLSKLDFLLPAELEAGEPPEARGLRRDQVRLLVSYYPGSRLVHTCFNLLTEYLEAGDVLVINTSGTLNAALQAERPDGERFELHLSTHLPGDLWVIEIRRPEQVGTSPYYAAQAGDTFSLPGGGQAVLLLPYRPANRISTDGAEPTRLWIGALNLPDNLEPYLERHGFPIRYRYVRESWPLSYYQTVYANQPGSAEMPSAGRAFTTDLITRLVSKGILFAPLLLHTGVSSLEGHEPPYEEYFKVSWQTAELVNLARRSNRRVVAVGTTAVRALESVSDPDGYVHSGEGWTDLLIGSKRGLRVVDGLITGLHEPKSSHLAMLAALAGYEHLELVYRAALAHKYLWHEFGDLHLLLP